MSRGVIYLHVRLLKCQSDRDKGMSRLYHLTYFCHTTPTQIKLPAYAYPNNSGPPEHTLYTMRTQQLSQLNGVNRPEVTQPPRCSPPVSTEVSSLGGNVSPAVAEGLAIRSPSHPRVRLSSVPVRRESPTSNSGHSDRANTPESRLTRAKR